MEIVKEIFRQASEFVPAWILGLGMVALGWILAAIVRALTTLVLRALRFDRLGVRTGLVSFLKKGRVSYMPSQLVGIAAYWGVLLATLFLTSILLDLRFVTSLWDSLATGAPSVLSAVFVLAVGWAAVSFLSNFTLTIARNASWTNAGLIARLVKVVGLVLVFTAAVEQIDLRFSIVNALLLVVAGGISLAFALAFGLGCQDLAREATKRFVKRLQEKNRPQKGSDLEG